MVRWWVVGSALSSSWCPRRALIRARMSSAGDCSGGQLPVWHCFLVFCAFRLQLWLCCDSVAPQEEEPRISSIAGSNGAALWLTLLSCAGSRGRFGDEAISMTVSFGAEAEGAARASAGNCSMLHSQK
eukprot:scaffold3223_cov115-Isochrysis_galbana.AAC.1